MKNWRGEGGRSGRTWGDGCFDDGDFEIRARLTEHICGAQPAGPGADDDDVAFGVGI